MNWSVNAALSVKAPNKVHVVRTRVRNVFFFMLWYFFIALCSEWQYCTKAILWTTGATVSVTCGCDVLRVGFILWAVLFPMVGLNVKFNLVKNLCAVIISWASERDTSKRISSYPIPLWITPDPMIEKKISVILKRVTVVLSDFLGQCFIQYAF